MVILRQYHKNLRYQTKIPKISYNNHKSNNYIKTNKAKINNNQKILKQIFYNPHKVYLYHK